MLMADPLALAVEIVKTSGQLTQSWMTRFLAVNGALMSAVGAIFGWQPAASHTPPIQSALSVICLLGIGASLLLWGVMHRQIRWHNAHVERVKALQDPEKPLFVDGMTSGGLRLIHMIPWMGGTTIAL